MRKAMAEERSEEEASWRRAIYDLPVSGEVYLQVVEIVKQAAWRATIAGPSPSSGGSSPLCFMAWSVWDLVTGGMLALFPSGPTDQPGDHGRTRAEAWARTHGQGPTEVLPFDVRAWRRVAPPTQGLAGGHTGSAATPEG